jgi:hypothetical protein
MKIAGVSFFFSTSGQMHLLGASVKNNWQRPIEAVGMQSGVCFGMETNLSTGERLVFLIGTDVSRR